MIFESSERQEQSEKLFILFSVKIRNILERLLKLLFSSFQMLKDNKLGKAVNSTEYIFKWAF